MLAPLLLAGCVNESASYALSGNGSGNDHTLTVIVTQDYFWKKEAGLRLIASRLPECQRQFELGKVSMSDLNIELFSTGADTFLLRSGDEQD